MIANIKGTKDILPDQIYKWQFLEQKLREVSEKYNYQEIRTPIFEKTEVFSRSIGEQTDIVNKEMYTFLDKGNESITLKPEMTASLVRAVIQHSLLKTNTILKLWYFGPFFRYERPQKGRLRQFHQYGAECIGSSFPESDVEIILLFINILKAFDFHSFKLLINTLGNDASRLKYRSVLIEFLNKIREKLTPDSQRRLETNPLRILDTKDPEEIELLKSAPNILDFLDDESKKHFDSVLSLLNYLDIKYEIKPTLVRGLDYYCHTVFEIQSDLLGAQDSIGGGGRYDQLFAQLGANPTPAVGFALGVERLLLVLEEANCLNISPKDVDICVIYTNEELINLTFKISETLRNRNYSVSTDLLRKSVKAQLREANKFNSKYCVILGDEEIKSNKLIIKNMITSEQQLINIEEINNYEFEI